MGYMRLRDPAMQANPWRITGIIMLVCLGLLPLHLTVDVTNKINHTNKLIIKQLSSIAFSLETEYATAKRDLEDGSSRARRFKATKAVLDSAINLLSLEDSSIKVFGARLTGTVWRTFLGILLSSIVVTAELTWNQ